MFGGFGEQADNIKRIVHEATQVQLEQFQTGDRIYHADLDVEEFLNARLGTDEERDPFYLFNDPTFTGFKIFFHWDATSGLLASESYYNSALAYLKRIGAHEQYMYMRYFYDIFQKISINSHWLFKSIEGLDSVWNNPFQNVRNHELDIKTFETLDTKIMLAMMFYRKACYDDKRGVYVLPVNLRRFSCSVYIYDMGIYRKTSSALYNRLRTHETKNLDEVHHLLIDLGFCEFDISSGTDFISEVSNSRSEANTNNIKFTAKEAYFSNMCMYMNIVDQKLYDEYVTESTGSRATTDRYSVNNPNMKKLLDYVSDSAIVRGVSDTYQALLDKNSWKNTIRNVATQGVKTLADEAMKKMTKMYLGNVYGFGVDDIAAIGRSGNPLAAEQMRKTTEATTQSLHVVKNKLGNIND